MVALAKGKARQALLFDADSPAYPLTAREAETVIRFGVRAALKRGLDGDVGHDAAVDGLIRAVRRYRPGRGAKLVTLACSGLNYRIAEAAAWHYGGEDALTHAARYGADPAGLDGAWTDREWFTEEVA